MRGRRKTGRRIPYLIVFIAALGALLFLLPFIGIALRLPWMRLSEIFGDPETRAALWLSIRSSAMAAALSCFFGAPLAYVLARRAFPGRSVIRALMTLAMVLPPVVGGVALLFTFGRNGFVGARLDEWLGIRLPYSSAGVVLAQTFVAMPFVVVAVESALVRQDTRMEEAARTLGASPLTVLRRITIPTIRPALLAGAALAWARALGEFGATITFAGSFPGRTQTLPLLVYSTLDTDPGAALALSFVLLAVAVVVLGLLRDFWFAGMSDRGKG